MSIRFNGSTIRISAAATLSLIMAGAIAAGDPIKGQRQFAPCTSCHTLDEDKIGPNLTGVYGKAAGTNRPGFAYSDALKTSHITWDEVTLDAWIKDPQALVPGSKMTFVGIVKDEVRANIIAYLKEQAK